MQKRDGVGGWGERDTASAIWSRVIVWDCFSSLEDVNNPVSFRSRTSSAPLSALRRSCVHPVTRCHRSNCHESFTHLFFFLSPRTLLEETLITFRRIHSQHCECHPQDSRCYWNTDLFLCSLSTKAIRMLARFPTWRSNLCTLKERPWLVFARSCRHTPVLSSSHLGRLDEYVL